MLKSRKKTALLSALTLLMCTIGTPVYADADEKLVLFRNEETGETQLVTEEELVRTNFQNTCAHWGKYIKGEHGDVEFVLGYRLPVGNYIITDGSDLPEEFLHPEWAGGLKSWLRYREINPDEINWTSECQAFLNQCPETARIFAVSPEVNAISDENWNILVRKLAVDSDSVLDCFYDCEKVTGTLVWDGRITSEVYYEDFRDEAFALEAEYQEWDTGYSAWLETIDTESMTAAEIEASRKAAGLMSPYEITYKIFDFYQRVWEVHGFTEQCLYRPTVKNLTTNPSEHYLQNIFEMTGDIDYDGNISASDAAAVQIASAKLGAGAESGLNDLQMINADINLDGNIDASDAALILQYAAESGTGSVASLKEFLKERR